MGFNRSKMNKRIRPLQEEHTVKTEEAEDVLERLSDSFAQVNIAADFLLIKEAAETCGPEIQLACLVKERISLIQEQVTELYRILNRESPSSTLLMH